MPNFGLVVTPTFNPMSYEQYVQPFKDYAEVYNKISDSYDALEMEAGQWEKLANSTTDAVQYQQYKRYADDLRLAANDLAENGLSHKTRSTLSTLRSRYTKEIKPISDAYTLREEERKAQRDARMKNPYIRFNRDAASTGLGAYMAGTPGYESVDLAQIKANVMADAKPLADELRDLRSGKLTDSLKWRTILGGQYYEAAKRKGFTSDAINEAISSMLQDPRTTPEQFGALNTIVNGAVESSGVTGWDLYNNNDAFRREVMQAATSGLWQAVGQTDFEHLANRNWDLTHRGSSDITTTKLPINPRNIYSPEGKKEAVKQLEKYSKYIVQNPQTGAYELTDEGKRQLSEYNKPINYDSNGAPTYSYKRNQGFISFIDNAVLGNEVSYATGTAPTSKVRTPLTLENAISGINTYFGNSIVNTDKYDATRYTEYNFAYDQDQQKDIRDAIKGLRVPLKEVSWDSKEAAYKDTGKELKQVDFEKLDVLEANFSYIKGKPYTVIILSNGKVYRMPAGINSRNEEHRDISLQYAENTRNKILAIENSMDNAGNILEINPVTGQPYTLAEYQALKEIYNTHISNAYLYHSQVGLRNKIKSAEYNPYDY